MSMTLNDYQRQAITTAIYPAKGGLIGKLYCALKLNGEAGEIAEKIGKVLRDRDGEFCSADHVAIMRELGDVLWYVNALALEFGLSLEDVALENLRKLAHRKETNTLSGSGDDREAVARRSD